MAEVEWISVKERLPESGRHWVYKHNLMTSRVTLARWIDHTMDRFWQIS
jgi:hypothetical protein